MIKKSQVKNDLLETERWEQSEAFALLDRSILQCLSQIIWVFSLFAMSSIFNFFLVVWKTVRMKYKTLSIKGMMECWCQKLKVFQDQICI